MFDHTDKSDGRRGRSGPRCSPKMLDVADPDIASAALDYLPSKAMASCQLPCGKCSKSKESDHDEALPRWNNCGLALTTF